MYAAITHLLDLHQHGDNKSGVYGKVDRKDGLLVREENCHKRTQVPLLCVLAQSLAIHLLLGQCKHVLTSESSLKSLSDVLTQVNNELVDELRHILIDLVLQLLRVAFLSQFHDVGTCKHLVALSCCVSQKEI